MDLFNKNKQYSLFESEDDQIEYICDISNKRAIFKSCYSYNNITSVFDRLHFILADMYYNLLNSEKVLIKVNITSPELPEQGKTTNPGFLSILIDYLLDINIRIENIIVADSSVIGIDTMKAANTCGIIDVCKSYNLSFLNLSQMEYLKIVPSHPLMQKYIHANAIWFDDSVFKINLGKIKTTYGSPVGLSIKNLKGLLSDKSKLLFHHLGLQESLVDLNNNIKADLSILEGFPSSELGIPKFCNLLGISNSGLLLDSITSELIGIPIENVPHLKIATETDNIDIEGIINDRNFKELLMKVPKLSFSSQGLEDLGKIWDVDVCNGNTCSGCSESFYKAIKRLSRNTVIPDQYAFCIGNEFKIPESSTDKYFIRVGNCAAGKGRIARLNKKELINDDHMESMFSLYLKGCPPTIDSIVNKTMKYLDNAASEIEDKDDSSYMLNTSKARSTTSSYIYSSFEILPFTSIMTANIIPEIVNIVPKEKIQFNELGHEYAVQCELVSAAICHQINWDFLRKRIFNLINIKKECLSFSNIQKIKSNDLKILLQKYHDPARILSEERAHMLRDLANLNLEGYDYFSEILSNTRNLIGGEKGLLSILQRSSVFNLDREMKKAQVLIHSLIQNNLWNCHDEDNLRPAIDYHIMRLNIRRGNLWPVNSLGNQYINSNINRRSMTTSAIRNIIGTGLRDIANLSGISIAFINAAEWWIGRTVCVRNNPDCNLDSEKSAWLKGIFDKCPYNGMCYAFNNDKSLLKTSEPRERSKYY